MGLLVLRHRDGTGPDSPPTSYRTWIGNPIIFAVVSSLLLARGVVSEPMQGAALAAVALVGLAVFYLKFGTRGFARPAVV